MAHRIFCVLPGKKIRTQKSLTELDIVDISNKAAPQLISTAFLEKEPHDIWYSNNRVYIAHRNGSVTTVDVSNPAVPLVNLSCMETYYTHNGLITAFNQNLQKEVLYVADHYGSPSLRIYDPQTNLQLGSFQNANDGREIEVTSDGKYVFQATWSGTPRINIFNVETSSNPTLIGSFNIFAHEMVISPDNQYLYILYDQPADNMIDGVMILDISSPANPAIVNTIPLSGARQLTIDHYGKKMFVKTRSDVATNPVPLGIYAYDINNLNNIRQSRRWQRCRE